MNRLHNLALTITHPLRTLRCWRLLHTHRDVPGLVQQHAPADLLYTLMQLKPTMLAGELMWADTIGDLWSVPPDGAPGVLQYHASRDGRHITWWMAREHQRHAETVG